MFKLTPSWVKSVYRLKAGKDVDAPRPDLILLDLNLPRKDDREVLTKIKTDDENLKRIPVVILTISEAEEDIFQTCNLNANCFITKLVELEQLIKVIQSVESFWFTTVTLLSNGKRWTINPSKFY